MMPLRVERIQPVLLGAAAGVVGLVALVGVVYRPVLRQMRERSLLVHELRTQCEDAKTLVPQLSAKATALQVATQRGKALELRVGRDQSVARVLDLLRAQASELKLEFTATQAMAEEGRRETPDVRVAPDLVLHGVPLTLKLTGRYRRIGEFLGMLGEAPFVAEVRHATMAVQPDQSPQLNAELDLVVYLTKGSMQL